MKYNNELRVINTQEKAYLLGFLYGDGTITTYKEKTGRIRFITKISINKTDVKLINCLYKEFPFLNEGEFDYSVYNENFGKQSSLTKSSKKLYDDLILNGLYPRKSYENKDKLKLPNIDNKLMSHFIRGFFDADGSVYTQKSRPNLIRIEFASVSYKFLNEINCYLKNIGINSWRITPKKGKQICYQLSYNKTIDVQGLINFMYNNANIKMERKTIKCLNYKPVDKVLDRNMTCKFCGSHFINKNGNRGKCTRYECKDCGKGFSIKNFLIKNISQTEI